MSERIFGVEELRQRLTRPPTHQQEARQTIARIQGMPLNELAAAVGTLDPRTLPRGYREALEARLRPEYVERATTPQVPGAEGAPRALTAAPVGAALGAQFAQLGQNVTRWEPTQAPMPEGDAPRLPPMVSPTTPDFDSRAALLAADEAARLSGLPLPPPAPPVRPRPPVVTPANATPGPQMPGGVAPGVAPDPAQQVQAAAQQAAAQGNNTLADRLMAFGFAMAASRNPSLFGQIGEAGQQVLQQRRQETQDDLQRRQVEGQLDYQQARVRLMEAELRWNQDPTNPRYIRELAQARAAAASASGAAQERDPLVARETDRDGNVFGITRSGRSVPLTDPQGRPFQPGRDETQDANTRRQLYATAYAQAWQSLAPDPMNPAAPRLSPEERQQRAHAVAQQAVQGAMGITGVQRGQQTAPQVQAPPPVNRGPTINLTGRPIQ